MTTERILIVDDEETLCEVLKLNLENEGVTLRLKVSHSAFRRFRAIKPVSDSG